MSLARNCGSCFSKYLKVFPFVEWGLARQVLSLKRLGIRSAGSTAPDEQCSFDDETFPIFNAYVTESHSVQGWVNPGASAANAQPFEQAGAPGLTQPVQNQ
jgi:hypothetical protein